MSETKQTQISVLRYAAAALLVLLAIVYANHFNNSFHFDDSHTIVDNPWIRDIGNIPHFFADGTTFSTLPPNRSYRPLVTASLALDYWLGKGLRPLWFHLSTFAWFTILCAAVFVLFRGIAARVRPGEPGLWAALTGAAVYAFHPVEAETVNYVIQRGDLYATLGIVAGLAIYAGFPNLRRLGFYLLPVVLGLLAKPPAAVFPALLVLWIWFFDGEDLRTAVVRSIPAFVVTGVIALFTVSMNPPTFVTGAASPWGYRISQPAVLMGYVRKFFLPFDLTADTDKVAVTSLFQGDAFLGFVFIALMLGVIWFTFKKSELRPIAFGLAWFLLTSLPTSLVALAEVENDHRMFLPFVGLSLSVVWTGMLLARQWRVPRLAVAAICCTAILSAAWGTRERNRVWKTEESLWMDVTLKSPKNGRGLMNYALTQMNKANYEVALDYLNRAALLNPTYYVLEINLGVANGAVGNAEKAESHFRRSVELAPADASARYFYARWLTQQRRNGEALSHLAVAIQNNPDYIASRHLAMEIFASQADAVNLRAEAQATLARFPADPLARSWLARAGNLSASPSAATAPPGLTAENLLNASLALYQARKYEDCIAAARQALAVRPNFPEAWNNIAAAYNSLGKWDDGIAAAKHAVDLKPDFQLARNNLAWAEQQKRAGTKTPQ